jgi:hypothetical protein
MLAEAMMATMAVARTPRRGRPRGPFRATKMIHRKDAKADGRSMQQTPTGAPPRAFKIVVALGGYRSATLVRLAVNDRPGASGDWPFPLIVVPATVPEMLMRTLSAPNTFWSDGLVV